MMGGSKEDRGTPGVEHWSIAVRDGKVLEKEWQTEIPIPRGGPHRFPSFPSSFHFGYLNYAIDFQLEGVTYKTCLCDFLVIPRRACVVFNDRLYTFGGQEGDFMAKPGSPIFKCSRRMEVVQFLTC